MRSTSAIDAAAVMPRIRETPRFSFGDFMADLSHFGSDGASRMVDVGEKPSTKRTATASACIVVSPETFERIQAGADTNKKGDVLEVARLAGIMAAKQTSNLIPLCHPLSLDSVRVDFTLDEASTIRVESTVNVVAKTGVEMEALSAVSIAALTVYDMCKSMDKKMTIESIRLESKSGGQSGDFQRTAGEA